ncbi:MAG: PHB depolymerase family esterase [Silicimonas sp.]|nr:PHB depolymerase family esterase [Silicimonas sp.]
MPPSPIPRVRRPLRQVVDLLSSARRAQTPKARGPAKCPAVPEGARYEARSHCSPFGERGYRLFVPSTRETSPAGLILMLHGCTQNADDFAVGTQMNFVAEKNNLVVIYADQTRVANQMGCWNWFRPEDQGRDAGEPALLSHLARQVAQEFGIGEGSVYVAGLSAGGAMAAILGQTYPDVFSAAGVHSGLAAGSARDVASAFAAMRGPGASPGRSGGAPVRTIVFHGTADSTVAPANADAVIEDALGALRHAEIRDRSETGATVTLFSDESGAIMAEKWSLGGVAHAWSGGSAEGSYTDPTGPDASVEMVRFFLAHQTEEQR